MIYFDNAATSWPKPPAVGAAMLRAMEEAGGNPGRGAHSLSLAAAAAVFECREQLAALLGLKRPEGIVFTYNTTHALNIAIKALARPGSAVLCSCLAHNAVLRPLHALGCRPCFYDPLADEEELLCEISGKLDRVSLVICTHASNILPIREPIGRISRLCRSRGVATVVDAAQSAGVLDIDMSKMKADAVCLAGHKALYGPAGCGAVAFADRYAQGAGRLATLVEGGSGVDSLSAEMPDILPERFEAGTVGVPAVAGLCAGLRAIDEVGLGLIREHECTLAARAAEILGNTSRVRLYIPQKPRGSILLFNIEGISPDKVAAMLDERGICVRAGLHCAPRAHERIGTLPAGAVRLSFGAFNSLPELEHFARAIGEISGNNKNG